MRKQTNDNLTLIARHAGEMPPEAFDRALNILARLLFREYIRLHPPAQGASAGAGANKPPDSRETPGNTPATAKRRLLSIGELSEYLGMPKSSIYTKVCTKKIPPKAIVKLGRSLKFDLAEIDAWIEQNRQGKSS